MNRLTYFNYIEEKLSILATRIELRAKKNLLDLNLHSENFYLSFFNELYGWQLQNMNVIKQNAEAIDLRDEPNQIIVQVSSTASKQKVESALCKDLSLYSTYSFKFISISKDASDLRSKTFNNPHKLTFDPQTDIYDVSTVLNHISALDIVKQKSIYCFIKRELAPDIDLTKIDTNLAAIMNILAKEDWDKQLGAYQINAFEIDSKIEFNKLDVSRGIIEDFKAHHNRIEKIYSEFNRLGVNKSSSVLSSIRREYLSYARTLNDDELFLRVIDRVVEKIQQSSNYVQIPVDELAYCAGILVVDAFIRCKIFENPVGSAYVAPR